MVDAGRPESKRSKPPAAVVTDEHGIVTAWSPQAEELTGHTASEMVGQPVWEICGRLAPPGRNSDAIRRRVKATVETILASGRLPEHLPHPRFRFRRSDGDVRTLEQDLSTVPTGNGIGLVALVREVQDDPDEGAGDTLSNIHRLLFKRMSNAVAVGETIVDETGKPVDYRLIDANPAFEALTGTKAEEVIGKRASELRPDLKLELLDRMGRVAVGGEPEAFEGRDPATDRYVRISLSRVGPTWVMAVIEDITEARRAEAALSERNAFVETVIASAGEGLIVYDRDLRYAVWNPGMEQLTGMSAGEVLGGKADALFPEVMATGVGEDLKLALAGEQPPSREFEYVIPSTGRRGWVVQTNRPHRNARGEIVGVVASVLDVTAQHEMDEAIGRSERQFRDIFDSMGDGVAISEPGGHYLEVNRVLCERLGYARDELVGMPVSAINSPESAATIPGRVERVMRYGEVRPIEVTHVRRDGTEIPIEAVSRHIEFRGRPAILSVYRDISERKQAERVLDEKTRFVQEFLNATPTPIVAKDRDGRVTQCNDAYAHDTYGRTRDEVVGRTNRELGQPEADVHTAHDRRAMETGLPEIYEADRYLADGTVRRVIVTKAPLRSADGEITGTVTASQDITERHEAEQALRQSAQLLQTLFDFASDAIFISNLDGSFVEVNRTACERLGYSHDELLTMTAADIDGSGYEAQLPERTGTLLTEGVGLIETTHLRKDGTAFPVEINATLINLNGGPAVLSVARDLTERKQAEAERLVLEEQLRQAQKMEEIGRLAGGIAHDFNNLLTAIRGNADLALIELPPGVGPREDLEQIQQAADRAASLTRQLLAFARRTVLKPEVVNLASIVRNLEPLLGRLIGEDVTLVTVAPAGTGSVLADPGQIVQVIVNLAVNAREAMPEGGTLTIEIADVEGATTDVALAATGPAGPMTSLSVSDTGIGMTAETLGHLFEPFFTTKGPDKGTGLGLAQVWGIVRASGGTVTARSEPGRGSTFTVFLPRVEETVEDLAEPLPADTSGGDRTGTILLVEDDIGVRRFATRVLERAGYRVLTAPDGTAAIETARSGPLELLVTDMVMPGLSGREVATKIVAIQPGIHVLYMSGHTEKGIVHDGVLEPDIDFLAKPFTSEGLLGAVAAAMTRKIAH